MKFKFGGFIIFMLIIISIIFVPYLLIEDEIQEVKYSQFIESVQKNEVATISEVPPYLIALKKSGERFKIKMISKKIVDDAQLTNLIREKDINIIIDTSGNNSLFAWIYSILPLLILAAIFFTLSKKQGQILKMNISTGAMDVNTRKFTFNDVAGLVEAKQDLMEIVEFLKYPLKFQKLGAKIPKGVLMLGEPGTGKTLLAKAIAGEAGVPFFNVSGSEFVELFVGAGASKVRDLFSKAKRYAPCIVFIDEIDAVARQRGSGYGGGNDEREQTLNQLLVEMDGFAENQNVIVIAATNRPTILDKAILRPGRFDRQVVVDIPSLKDREEILYLHAKNKPVAANVDFKQLARKTAGLVGAELESILNEAAIFAARNSRDKIYTRDIEDALERVIAGPERKSKTMSAKEKEIVAYHESGHALVAYTLPNTTPIHKISIIPRGKSTLGYVMRLPEEDKYMWSRTDLLNEIRVAMGGRAAEELVFNEITSGASSDIEKATAIARNMIGVYGMSSEIGLHALFPKESAKDVMFQPKEYSEKVAEKLDAEVKDIISKCYEDAKLIIKNNFEKLKMLKEHLIREEIIFENEIATIIGSSV